MRIELLQTTLKLWEILISLILKFLLFRWILFTSWRIFKSCRHFNVNQLLKTTVKSSRDSHFLIFRIFLLKSVKLTMKSGLSKILKSVTNSVHIKVLKTHSEVERPAFSKIFKFLFFRLIFLTRRNLVYKEFL